MSEILKLTTTIFISLHGIVKVIFRDWHVRKFINFSNLLKLIFLYSACLIWIILFETDYSKNFWSKSITGEYSNRRFSFYTTRDRIGEGVLYDRMVVTANKLGYDYSAFKFPESLTRFWLTSHFYKTSTSIVNYIFKPQFNLALTHHVNILPSGYNITYLNMPLDALFKADGDFITPLKHLGQYDAYVDLYSLLHSNNELLQDIIKQSDKNKPVLALYFAQNEEKYHPVTFDKALITGTLWGCNRNSLRIAQSLKKLADNGFLVGIGVKDYLGFLEKAYLGKMEDFGNAIDSLQLQQQKYGIALIVHNQEHMLDGIPTSRIAEAVSTGSLVISDQNKFITKFFGDSVLYYDVFAEPDEIYNTVKSHIEWARNNPAKAHEKTKKAYKIFMDNFTMENQLDKLFSFVEVHSIKSGL